MNYCNKCSQNIWKSKKLEYLCAVNIQILRMKTLDKISEFINSVSSIEKESGLGQSTLAKSITENKLSEKSDEKLRSWIDKKLSKVCVAKSEPNATIEPKKVKIASNSDYKVVENRPNSWVRIGTSAIYKSELEQIIDNEVALTSTFGFSNYNKAASKVEYYIGIATAQEALLILKTIKQ